MKYQSQIKDLWSKPFGDNLLFFSPKFNTMACRRFAPEPSGYLHLGHVKAFLLPFNKSRNNGELFVLRLDDTNPNNIEYKYIENIFDTLRTFDVTPDKVYRSSEMFDLVWNSLLTISDKIYIDDSTQDEITEQREMKLPSPNRYIPFDINNINNKSCIRIRIDYKNNNGCLRDPVIYRYVNETLLPTYDFCTPILDHHDNVVEVMRDRNYMDRDELYSTICRYFGYNIPKMTYFSRFNIKGTKLSKRYMKQFDDPFNYCLKNMIHRGFSPKVISDYMMESGELA